MILFTGEAAMRVSPMQDLFYDKMLADDRVNFFFQGVDMKKQRAHQVSHPACLLTCLVCPQHWLCSKGCMKHAFR